MNDAINLDESEQAVQVVSQPRLPVLMIAVGRGRVGKTTFLNIVGQRFRERGAVLDIWSIDPHGETGAIHSFFPDVRRPSYSGVNDRQKWVENMISEQSERRFDALLDVGGGDLVLEKVTDDMDLGAVAESMGVRVVVVQLLGPSTADLDHFDLSSVGSGPNIETLLVLNCGLIVGDISPIKAFEPVFESPILKSAINAGGMTVMLPHLVCLETIVDRKMTFQQASDRSRHGTAAPLSIFDAARVRKWWTTGLDVTFDPIPATWLPALPEMKATKKAR